MYECLKFNANQTCGLSEIPLIRAMRATLLIRNDLIENHDALYNSMIAIAIYKI